MPKNLHKSIHVCLSKLKRAKQNNHHNHSSPSLVNSSPKKWILSGCKHSRTLSFAVEKTPSSSSGIKSRQDGAATLSDTKSREDGAATLSDIDRFLFENFNSLYHNENDNLVVDEKGTKMMMKNKKNEDSRRDNGNSNSDFLFESPRLMYPPPDRIRASSRFFVSPGTSGSLVEENRSSTGGSSSTFDDIGSSSSTNHHTCTTTPSDQSLEVKNGTDHNLAEDSVAVLRNSPNPYDDFRRSMQEMIEARLDQNQSVDWDFMEELLFCYLKLNEKKSYKYILGAFVDLIVNLRQNNTGKSQTRSRRVSMKRKEIKKIVKRKDCVT
ncbi:hypothetical protein C5167_034870 [Papaver somniferum]|uniref:Transcription repressor n=1 Tax=Papaver somniferum TaxID=3469 RepID=A0A4Y7KH80_PAPSO|nr:transcription repressor OFP14-like [Papaver somniferum]RZC71710.1 hypothetical protein C5167_034870 [Papaver somniferum]